MKAEPRLAGGALGGVEQELQGGHPRLQRGREGGFAAEFLRVGQTRIAAGEQGGARGSQPTGLNAPTHLFQLLDAVDSAGQVSALRLDDAHGLR